MDLDTLVGDLNRRYKRTVIKTGPPSTQRTIPTGLANLDLALNGGVMLGRQFAIVGNEGSGKTTLALSIAREAISRGMWVLWADCERSLDWDWATRVGIETVEQFATLEGLTGEDAFKTIRDVLSMIRDGDPGKGSLIVVDSIAAMVPADDFENRTTVAPGARLVNRALRVWNALQTSTVGMVLINQYRSGISSFKPTLPHGMGQLYHFSQRLDLRDGQWIKDNDTVIGKEIKYSIRKSKVGTPYQKGLLDLYFERSGCFDRVKSLAIAAVSSGVVPQSGSWYTLPAGNRVQGISNLMSELEDDKIQAEVERLVIDMYRFKPYGENIDDRQ